MADCHKGELLQISGVIIDNIDNIDIDIDIDNNLTCLEHINYIYENMLTKKTWKHLLRQQDITVLLAVHLHPTVDKYQFSHTHL